MNDSPLHRHLSQYASYHRDARNVATHFVGVPLIVAAVVSFLSRPALAVGSVALTPAMAAAAAVTAFYLRLDRRYGLVMGALLAATVVAVRPLSELATGSWLALSGGAFVVGWAIQFVGHWFEGRKPAFVDDLVGLVVGPLFVVAEAGFALGLRLEVKAAVEQSAGPLRARTPTAA